MLDQRQQQQGSAAELAAVLRSSSPGRQQPLWTELGSLNMPALFIAGALDSKFVQLGQAMAAGRKGGGRVREEQQDQAETNDSPASFEAVPGCGHAVHVESPEQLAPMLAEFVQRVAREC